jgi:hypothetical protein
MMLTTAVVLFALAALGGTVLAKQASKGQPSTPLAVGHGLLATAGLITLFVAFVGGTGGLATAALALFVVAALGGFFLFAQHMRGNTLPRAVIGGHAAAATVALVLLLVAALR